MQMKDMENLANLARLEMAQSEKESIMADLGSILGYIAQIERVEVSQEDNAVYKLRNVFRADENPYASGAFSEIILKEAPKTQDNYIKVPKIL